MPDPAPQTQFDKLYQKGLEAVKKENFGYAVELFSTAITLKPEDGNCRHQLHLALIQQQKKQPLSLIYKIINLPKYLWRRIEILRGLRNKNYRRCLILFEQNLKLMARVNDLLRLAKLLHSMGLAEQSRKTYIEILTINPGEKTALIELIKTAYAQKDFPQAKEHIQALLHHHPHNHFAVKTLRDIDAIKTMGRSRFSGDQHQ